MKYAVFKGNQFIKFTDTIIPGNPDYMHYEINLYIPLLQRVKFLFTGKL